MWRDVGAWQPLSRTRGIVRAPLIFDDTHTGDVITVPVGFVSDGASIPHTLRRVVGSPLHHRYVPAAILHDYEIATGDQSWLRVHTRFHRALRASGNSPLRSSALASAVFLFGPR